MKYSEENRETILVLGNGFDIAHGLPTSYIDFIRFEQVIKDIVLTDNEEIDFDIIFQNREINKRVGQKIREYTGNITKTACMEGNLFSQKAIWKRLLENNFWISHFEHSRNIGEGWIDFEAEMGDVLSRIDKLARIKEDNEIVSLPELVDFGLIDMTDYLGDEACTIEDIIKNLLDDLNKLRRALEIYFSDYVEVLSLTEDSKVIWKIKPTKVISFNYTKTYERTYGQDLEGIEYTYIHGIADARRLEDDNDMVLGIDEFLNEEEKNQRLLCIDFKKYYQRLVYCCSRDAEVWADRISAEDLAEEAAKDYVLNDGVQITFVERNEFSNPVNYKNAYLAQQKANDDMFIKHRIIIFGHSLGESDKYILRKLLLHNNTEVVIYYHNKKSHRNIIKNLVRVIGQDELIMRTGNKRIVFEHT